MTRKHRSARQGFTLIELLIVVAIIAILAAIAVPNFLEAQTRAKVSRALADMRSLTTAVEAYRVDNNRYPPRTVDPANRTQLAPPPLATPIEDSRPRSLSFMTSPIAYITTTPTDPFESTLRPPLNTLEYWDDLQSETFFDPSIVKGHYILCSVGPDMFGGWGNAGTGSGYPVDDIPGTFRVVYDPTNGTISWGTIFRLGGNGNPPPFLSPNTGAGIML